MNHLTTDKSCLSLYRITIDIVCKRKSVNKMRKASTMRIETDRVRRVYISLDSTKVDLSNLVKKKKKELLCSI